MSRIEPASPSCLRPSHVSPSRRPQSTGLAAAELHPTAVDSPRLPPELVAKVMGYVQLPVLPDEYRPPRLMRLQGHELYDGEVDDVGLGAFAALRLVSRAFYHLAAEAQGGAVHDRLASHSGRRYLNKNCPDAPDRHQIRALLRGTSALNLSDFADTWMLDLFHDRLDHPPEAIIYEKFAHLLQSAPDLRQLDASTNFLFRGKSIGWFSREPFDVFWLLPVFTACSSLEELDLSRNEMDDKTLASFQFSSLTRLRTLSLARNCISLAGIQSSSLSTLSRLEQLDLGGIRHHAGDELSLACWPRLLSLTFHGRPAVLPADRGNLRLRHNETQR